ncbi:MAG: hypothetical protein RLZZ479_896 [Bacteroidota bacterium]|jgi:hypothetical protein
MILGIDFSIKSAAATLKTENSYNFYSYARNGIIKEKDKQAFLDAEVLLFESDEEAAPHKKASIGERERTSVKDALLLIPQITNCFAGIPIKEWGIEGFSFASTGNRLAQISGYQWVLRWELIKNGLDIENFNVYSPMTVKSTAGKGNFKKENMIEAFINSTDAFLINTSLHKSLKENPEKFQNKKGAWLKPLDDIVDSYWVLKTIEAHHKTI